MKAPDILDLIYGKHRSPIWNEATIAETIERWTDPQRVFENIASAMQVTDYLEVGSWLGGSAIRAFECFEKVESITCVDTWLGSAEHWTQSHPSHNLHRTPTGQPGIFGKFLANMKAARIADEVAPVRLPSTIAAEVMAHHDLTFDVIYLDGAHDFASVLADCRAWWPRTRRVLMGDDWADPRFGVSHAVLRWLNHPKTAATPANLRVDGNFWMVVR